MHTATIVWCPEALHVSYGCPKAPYLALRCLLEPKTTGIIFDPPSNGHACTPAIRSENTLLHSHCARRANREGRGRLEQACRLRNGQREESDDHCCGSPAKVALIRYYPVGITNIRQVECGEAAAEAR